jgi:organic radical activating enzyme
MVRTCEQVGKGCKNVSFCGGEPTLQLDSQLVEAFKGWYKSIETNGLRALPKGLDYVVCSPKTKQVAIDRADELRFVLKVGDVLPTPPIAARHYYLSPCFDGDTMNMENVRYCVESALRSRQFKVSIQTHKILNIE